MSTSIRLIAPSCIALVVGAVSAQAQIVVKGADKQHQFTVQLQIVYY